MKYDYVIFDLDGTLVDTSPDINASINFILDKLNLPKSSLEQCKSYVGSGLKKTLSNALDDRNYKYNEEQLEILYKDFFAYYKENPIDYSKPYDGALSLLNKLKDKGLFVSVISNKEDNLARFVLSNMFNNFKFNSIWGIKDDGIKKPDPIGYLWTKEKLNIKDDSKVLFIGDSKVDRQFALNSKLDYRLVTWGFVPKEVLSNLDGNSRLVDSYKDLEKELL